MTKNHPFQLVYIGRSRLQRNRANIIQTLNMVHAFRTIGIDAQLYLPPWPRSLDKTERLAEFGLPSDLPVYSSRLLHSRWKLWPFVRLYRDRLRRADGVFVRSLQLSEHLARGGIAHTLEVHDANFDLIQKGYLADVVAWHQRGLIRWLVTVSRAGRETLVSAGADEERILTCPNGVDLEVYGMVPPFDPCRLAEPHIVYLGRLSFDRGLKIFESLARSGEATITLIGEQDDVCDSDAPIQVLPFIPPREVPNWWGRSDLVLLPYQRHLAHADSISPIKLFETMAAGRPIIASDLPPIREILEHEKTALLVDPEDTEGWIAAVRRLRSEPYLASRLARAAKAKAVEYSWEKRAERLAKACGWFD